MSRYLMKWAALAMLLAATATCKTLEVESAPGSMRLPAAADPDARDELGHTPLRYTRRSKNRAVSAALGKARRNRRGGTPLPGATGNDQRWQTQGIILAFNEWADEQEIVLISEELKTSGLEKTGELPITKVWFLKYTDNEFRHSIEAYAICKKLSEKFSVTLKYCRPEYIPRTR